MGTYSLEMRRLVLPALLEGTPLVVGDGVKVTKGSKGLGIEKGWGGKVKAITPDEGGSGKLEIFFRDGKTRVLWVRHMNRLADGEFNVNRGDPTQSATLLRIPAGQPVPGFASVKKPEVPQESSPRGKSTLHAEMRRLVEGS